MFCDEAPQSEKFIEIKNSYVKISKSFNYCFNSILEGLP